MESEHKKMGNRLIELRKANGLTQGQLAEAINISRQSISEWEREISKPTQDNLLRLCELYGVTVDYLLGRDVEISSAPKREQLQLDVPDQRLRFYRSFTLILAILLVVISLLFIQSQKNIQKIPIEDLPTDIVNLTGEFG